jgi:glycosyltransferase involved in cell wall biosynthesis
MHIEPMDRGRSGSRRRSYEPLISIGIPTRNRASIVRGAVERAFAQSYANIEVLVSDNASTDDTVATLRSIAEPRLRILTSREDIGCSANYAKCIREASGEFVLIVPDDDSISTTFVDRCVGLLNEEPGVQAVVGAYGVFFADENRERPAVLSGRLSTGIWDGTEILKEFLRGQLSAITLSMLIRTKLMQGSAWPSEYHTADDVLVMARVLLSGHAGLLNEQCATLTIHNYTVSNAFGLDHGFNETQEVMGLISDASASVISSEASRRELQDLTAFYVAKKLFDFLVLYRRQGATLRDVVRKLQIWRTQSRQCRLAHFAAALNLRSLTLLLLPAPTTKRLLSLREAFQARGLLPAA